MSVRVQEVQGKGQGAGGSLVGSKWGGFTLGSGTCSSSATSGSSVPVALG